MILAPDFSETSVKLPSLLLIKSAHGCGWSSDVVSFPIKRSSQPSLLKSAHTPVCVGPKLMIPLSIVTSENVPLPLFFNKVHGCLPNSCAHAPRNTKISAYPSL